MKFNTEETVNGADITSGVTLLTFQTEGLEAFLHRLDEAEARIDALEIDGDGGRAAVFFPQGICPWSEDPEVISPAFRLRLTGRRLQDGEGLSALFHDRVAEEKIPLFLSCSSGTGISAYFPETARGEVLSLLERLFGIRAV